MTTQRFQGLGLAALTCLSLGMGALPSLAASPFGQKDVDQSKYAVIAMPLAQGGYKLLVVEQVSNKRQCWAENGNAPTVIEPLLVTFDFTGICGRSTDSNGYSIRVEQQDMGIDYRLSIEQQGSELFLTGIKNRGSGEAKMVIGRTHGLVPGAFMKFYLEPSWRLTRRTFEDRTLGHVYFTSDSLQAAFNAPIQSPPVTTTSPEPVIPAAGQPPSETTTPSLQPSLTPETTPASATSTVPQAPTATPNLALSQPRVNRNPARLQIGR